MTEVPQQPGIDRRRLLKGAVVAGGAAMVTPTVLSLSASPASASAPFGAVVQGTSTAASLTLSIAAPSSGVLVAAVAVRRNVLLSFTRPTGWSQLSVDLNDPRINLAVFAVVLPAATPLTAYTFGWGINRPAAGWVAFFPGGVGWDPIGARTIPGSATTAMTGASVTPTALSTVCMIGGYNTPAVAPSVSAPPLYTPRAIANAGAGSPDFGAGVYLATRVFAAGGPTGNAVATLSSANRNIGCLLAVH